MIGFWTPIWRWIELFLVGWGRALHEAAPPWLQRHLKASNNPTRIDLNSASGIECHGSLAGRDIDVVLTSDLVLCHTCWFPETVYQEVNKAIALEAERVMPVAADQLYIAHQITSKVSGAPLEVHLVAAQKRVVDQILQNGKKGGLTIRSVAAEFDGLVVPFSLKVTWSLKLKRQMTLFAGVAIALFISLQIPKLYLNHLDTGITATDQAIQLARKNTVKIAGLQKRVDTLQGLSSAVSTVKKEGQALELLSVLTAMSPDEVSIEEMRLDGQRLYLGGRAVAPEDWVISLQQNAAFEDVRLTSVFGQTNEQIRRFEVHAKVLWPHERAGR